MKYSIFFFLSTVLVASCFSSKSANGSRSSSPNFDKKQMAMIMEADTASPMRVWKTTNNQDSILLRKKSARINVTIDDPSVRIFAKRLYSTVRDSASMGVGIAAPQVGILRSMIWVQRFDKKDFPFECYINPSIVTYSEEKFPCMEGCLSIPEKQEMTKDRSQTIEIEFDRLDGSHHKESVKGFTSVIFQHEIDHLHGILFIDHLEAESK